jgi:Arc/MetJ-type ribon-helix-helix transcriptional regulator
MAEVVRDAVEQLLREDVEATKWERALALLGRYHSGVSDVSENHDAYLDEAYLP